VRHLLLATDFSDNAEVALERAVSLALHHGARLSLVHSMVPLASPAGFVPAPEATIHTYREAAQERLSGLQKRLQERVAEVDAHLVFGTPHRAILETADRLHPDLLVVGTRGLTGLAHLLLGSTAERVIQHATVPVLTVPLEAADHHRPLERLLVPTDFSTDAQLALEAAGMLPSTTTPAKVVLLNVYYSPIIYTAYGSVPTTTDYLEDFRGEAVESLEKLAETLASSARSIQTIAREGTPSEVILQVAEELEVDLVAMGTRGRGGISHLLLGSTAERVVRGASCPVLTVNRRSQEEAE
jgi:nucleotide-binding universal stress UspA family protein